MKDVVKKAKRRGWICQVCNFRLSIGGFSVHENCGYHISRVNEIVV